MVCLGNGVYRISGVPRMHERPQKARYPWAPGALWNLRQVMGGEGDILRVCLLNPYNCDRTVPLKLTNGTI